MTEIMQKWRDQPAAVPTLSEKAKELIAELARRYAIAAEAGKATIATELQFLNATRDCGVLLDDARTTLSKTQWQLAQAEFAFNERQVRGLLEFARRFPQPITDAREAVRSLGDAQMALGLAEFPEGHGPQQQREHNFALDFTKLVTSARAKIHRELEAKPIATWEPQYARQFVQQSSPLVRELTLVLAEAEKRAAA